MSIPLEKESKMWGVFYSSDFHKLMFTFIGDALAFMFFFTFLGLEGALVLFFAIITVVTIYFVMKSFWPEKYFENIIKYHNEPKHYFPGGEKSELHETL